MIIDLIDIDSQDYLQPLLLEGMRIYKFLHCGPALRNNDNSEIFCRRHIFYAKLMEDSLLVTVKCSYLKKKLNFICQVSDHSLNISTVGLAAILLKLFDKLSSHLHRV